MIEQKVFDPLRSIIHVLPYAFFQELSRLHAVAQLWHVLQKDSITREEL
jgi:hypothetical protein